MRHSFAAFILTHGRPDKVYTYDTLRSSGYTGPIYLIVDDLDDTAPEYIERFGKEFVVIFDKKAIAETFDQADNFEDMRSIVYARNASFEIAKGLGLKCFLQLDDDYTDFLFTRAESGFKRSRIKDLDRVFDIVLDYFEGADAITSIAFAQGGDFIGGEASSYAQSVKATRKCMNSFFCSTERPFRFTGRLNEDVNTYTGQAPTGRLFLTTNQVQLNQIMTQSNSGGMTDIYAEQGTYVKSFYSVIHQPSSVSVGLIRGRTNTRLHHRVNWDATAPKILRESLRN